MVDSAFRLPSIATDPAGATAAARTVLGSAEVVARPGAFVWEQVPLVDDGVTVSSVRSRGDGVRLRLGGEAELIVLQVASGEAVLSADGQRRRLGPGDLGLIPLGSDAEVRWNAVRLELFTIPATPLARLLGVPRSAVRLRVPRIDPCSPELAEYFCRMAAVLTSDVFGSPQLSTRDLVRATTIEALLAVVVEAFELTNVSEDVSDRDGAIIRRAIAEMRARLREPVTVPDIAAAAGVSVRGLQMAFQRQLGVGPLLHLRQLRLEAARSALIDEATVGTTVAEIARRFGYANSGRFSTHFRDEYGEAPSATLQRARGAAAVTAKA